MKKKILSILLAIVNCIFCVMGLAGCSSEEVLSFERDYIYDSTVPSYLTEVYYVRGYDGYYQDSDDLFARYITIPKTYNGKTVAAIASEAFKKEENLKSITIPSTITRIGDQAFFGCSNLKSVSMKNSVTYLGDSVFYGCEKLSNITLSSGLTSIPNDTFNGCSSLSSIKIPNSVTSIGSEAFYGCSKLSKVQIPYGVASLGYGVFAKCTKLKTIEIPATVTSISSDAFEGCEKLSNITFEGSMYEWENIYKGWNWNDDIPATKVSCRDGDVQL